MGLHLKRMNAGGKHGIKEIKWMNMSGFTKFILEETQVYEVNSILN